MALNRFLELIRQVKTRLSDAFLRIVYHRMTIGFPWYWPAKGAETPAMRLIRRTSRQLIAHGHPWPVRWAVRIFAVLTWPLGAAVHLRLVRANTDEFDAQDLKAHWLDAYWVALRHNVWPAEYFSFRLWLPENRRNVDNYFYIHEIPRVFAAINPSCDNNPVGDKLLFHQFCQSHALPTLPLLAVVTPETDVPSIEIPPATDLWIKPAKGNSGRGAAPWYGTDGGHRNLAGQVLNPTEFRRHLVDQAQQFGRMLVQPLARNHPALEGLPDRFPLVIRVVTGKPLKGIARVISAYAALPNDLQHLSQGAELCPIDLHQGTLEHNSALLPIPAMPSLLQSVLRGHDQLPDYALLGWDAFCERDGTKLLETNANISTNEVQRLQERWVFGLENSDEDVAERIHLINE